MTAATKVSPNSEACERDSLMHLSLCVSPSKVRISAAMQKKSHFLASENVFPWHFWNIVAHTSGVPDSLTLRRQLAWQWLSMTSWPRWGGSPQEFNKASFLSSPSPLKCISPGQFELSKSIILNLTSSNSSNSWQLRRGRPVGGSAYPIVCSWPPSPKNLANQISLERNRQIV